MSGKHVILVHGGAGTLSTVQNDGVLLSSYEKGVRDSALAGWNALKEGGSAVDAVQAAIMSMEESPVFNAGRGSYLTDDGKVEMDASIMDGTTMKAGGVTCIKNVLYPVKVARFVMDKTDHCLLAGDDALTFAVANGMERIDDDKLMTQKAKTRFEKIKGFKPSVDDEFVKEEKSKKSGDNKNLERGHDTVGAVCLDKAGNLAYATSTGGINAKMPGRVGDSPIIGSGGYADSVIGAVSTTGHGESFMKTVLGTRIILDMESGKTPQKACEDGLQYMLSKVGGVGGTIGLNKGGDIGINFTTEGMSWSYVTSDDSENINYGIYPGEHNVMAIQAHESQK